MVVRILKCSHEELVGTIQTVYQSVANGIMFVNEKYGVIFVPDSGYVEQVVISSSKETILLRK